MRALGDRTASHKPLTLELASSDTPSMNHIMTRTLRPAARKIITGALVLACFAASCAAATKPNSSVTKMVTSWKDPTATISSSQTKKILFVALVKDEAYSTMMENQLVEMSHGKGIAAHTFIKGGSTTERDKAAFEQKIRSEGIDLVLVMRLKDTKEEPRYVAGSYGGYSGYWGYYNYVAPMYNTPGFYTSDKHFLVETNVYSVAQSKLLWSGVTDTVNPSYRTTTTIGEAVIASMKKEGFLVE